jgi:peptidoglycan/xylan/chitin deacetylase (PgdA/CDA1 family)
LLSHLTRRGIILTYHSVAERDEDPWRLSVSPNCFADHMKILRDQARPVTLEELVAKRMAKHEKPAVAVTFDDGYANNLSAAKPLLERYDIPATVFVCSGYLERGREYWWDELAGLLLRAVRLPDELVLEIDGSTKRWNLADAVEYTESQQRQDQGQGACDGSMESPRMGFYFKMWRELQPLADRQRSSVLDRFAAWAEYRSTVRPGYRAMTRDELCALAVDGLVQIGSHTVTHPNLLSLPEGMRRAEIEQGKQDLEEIVNRRVVSFAYPFGAYDRGTVEAVRRAGCRIACTTTQEAFWAGSSRFRMPRFNALSWDEDRFASLLASSFVESSGARWRGRT